MLSRIGVANYKPISDKIEVPFNKINVITGINSCGKSSLIQAILMLKKVYENNNPNEIINISPRKFKSIINKNDIRKALCFKYVINLDKYENILPLTEENIKWNKLIVDFGIKHFPKDKNYIEDKFHVNYVNIIWVGTDNIDNDIEIELRIKSLEENTETYKIDIRIEDENMEGKFLNKFSNIIKKNNEFKIKFNKFFPASIQIPNKIVNLNDKDKKDESSVSLSFQIPEFFNEVPYEILENASKTIHYFNPLRDRPSREYVITRESKEENVLDEMSEQGDNAIQILCKEKDNFVEYYDELGKYRRTTLQEAVEYWMINVMRLTKKVKIVRSNLGLIQDEYTSFVNAVYFSSPYDDNILSGMDNVGFGISQIFPIIVEGLRAEKGHVIICEQPEIHLHPRVQTLLADFFISLAKKGVTVIIETHSDHLINSFSYNTIKDKSTSIKDLINLLYFEKEIDKLKLKKIRFNSDGVVEQWPEDFLGNEHTLHLIRMTKAMQNANEGD